MRTVIKCMYDMRLGETANTLVGRIRIRRFKTVVHIKKGWNFVGLYIVYLGLQILKVSIF